MSKESTSKRSVLDERFLKCGVCNEQFWDNSKLIMHMESHSETKLLLCTICNKNFTSIQDLDKHYLLHRQLMQPYGCPACESRFLTQQQLVTHVDNIHPELTIGDSKETKVVCLEPTRRNSPRSNKKQIKVVSDQTASVNLAKKLALPEKCKEKTPVKIPGKSLIVKKSILKIVPTPVGKKRPLKWKDPIVSPEKNRQMNSISVVPCNPGKKRKLVNTSQVSTDAKKLKVVHAVDDKTPTLSVTPVRKTPIAKTKLMQSISNLQKIQMLDQKKSVIQTRKNLLNALTITPVTKGPIRVAKGVKQPFIVYSPSKDKTQSDPMDILARNIMQKPFPSSGKLNESKQNDNASPQDFDKLLPSAKTSPIVNTSSDNKEVIQQVLWDDLKKKQVPFSNVNVVQLIPIPPFRNAKPLSVPELTNQATSPGNTAAGNYSNTTKSKNLFKCTAVKDIENTKFLKQMFPSSTSPKEFKIIPQSPLTKTIVQKSPTNKVVTTTATSDVRPTRNQKLVGFTMSPVSSTVGSATQFISETELLKNPVGKGQKLQILLPSITLKRYSNVDCKEVNEKGLFKAVSKSNSGKEVVSQTTNAGDVKEHISINSVEEADKLQPEETSILDEPVKSKQVTARGSKRHGKMQSEKGSRVGNTTKQMCTEAQNMEKAGVEKKSNLKQSKVNSVKTRGKILSTEARSFQEKAKSNCDKRDGINTRGKSQLEENMTEVKELSIPSTIEESAQLLSVTVSPKLSTRNAVHSKSGMLKEEPMDNVVIETKTIANDQHTNGVRNKVVSRRRNKPKAQVANSVTEKVPVVATRRSKRMLLNDEKNSPKDLKKSRVTVQRRKGGLRKSTVEKAILKKVIEEEVKAMEMGDDVKVDGVQGDPDSNVTTLHSPTSVRAAVPNNIRVVTLTPEVMKKLKETVLKKTSSTTPNHIRLVVPSEVLYKIQNSAARSQNGQSPCTSALKTEGDASPSNLKITVVPPPTKIVRYGLEDLKRDQQRMKEEKEKLAEKEKILKKMLEKFDEKEKKKQMKFCEKKLTRFVAKHREAHLDEIKDRLLKIRHLSHESGVQLLEDVKCLSCLECEEVVGKTLCGLGYGDERDLFTRDKAMQGFVKLSTSKVKSRRSLRSVKVSGAPKDVQKRPCNKRSRVVAKIEPSPEKLVSPKKEPMSSPEETGFSQCSLTSKSQVMAKIVQSPKKLVSPKKQPLSPEKTGISQCSPNKGDLSKSKSQVAAKVEPSPKKFSSKKLRLSSPEKTGFSLIECSPNKGDLSYSNNGGGKKLGKRKVLPKPKPVKTRLRKPPQRKTKKANLLVDDPFVDVSIVTEEKYVIECPCTKPNCGGLHPENFFI